MVYGQCFEIFARFKVLLTGSKLKDIDMRYRSGMYGYDNFTKVCKSITNDILNVFGNFEKLRK